MVDELLSMYFLINIPGYIEGVIKTSCGVFKDDAEESSSEITTNRVNDDNQNNILDGLQNENLFNTNASKINDAHDQIFSEAQFSKLNLVDMLEAFDNDNGNNDNNNQPNNRMNVEAAPNIINTEKVDAANGNRMTQKQRNDTKNVENSKPSNKKVKQNNNYDKQSGNNQSIDMQDFTNNAHKAYNKPMNHGPKNEMNNNGDNRGMTNSNFPMNKAFENNNRQNLGNGLNQSSSSNGLINVNNNTRNQNNNKIHLGNGLNPGSSSSGLININNNASNQNNSKDTDNNNRQYGNYFDDDL